MGVSGDRQGGLTDRLGIGPALGRLPTYRPVVAAHVGNRLAADGGNAG
jgi:hypothetical protein